MLNRSSCAEEDSAYGVPSFFPFRKIFLLTSLCLVLLVTCAFHDAHPPVLLTIAENGNTVTVVPGTQVIVQLPNNSGSTGYIWSFTLSGKQVLVLQSTNYISPRNRPMVGVPGSVVFTFSAQNMGSAHLQFELRRPWESGGPPARLFTVSILVQHDSMFTR